MRQNVKVIDEYKDFVILSGDFSHAKPKIQDEQNATDILSFSHSAYNIRTDPHIDAANFYAATELGAKFKSREAVYKYFGLDFNGEEATCQEINKLAYDLVLQHYNGSHALERFEKHGQPIEFVADTSS